MTLVTTNLRPWHTPFSKTPQSQDANAFPVLSSGTRSCQILIPVFTSCGSLEKLSTLLKSQFPVLIKLRQ